MSVFEAPKKLKNAVGHNPMTDKLAKTKQGAFERFPLFFTLMAAFGLVATTDGFSRLMQKVPMLANNPYITLIVGLVILSITGTLYKKL
jgi:hypothetical protein